MSEVDDYLTKVTPKQREVFEQIRKIVHELAPGAEETKSYGMPAFKYKKKYLVAFFAYKDHLSLFPTSGPIAALAGKLNGFTTAKGTIQFTEDHQLPEQLIREIVQYQIDAIDNGGGYGATK